MYFCTRKRKQMEQETFQISDALRVLAFEFEDADISSVYFVDKLSSYIDNGAYSPYVITGLEEARNFEADAVYFRMMDNGQPPMPQIFIYDNVTHRRSERDFARIHRNIWSAAVIPLYFVLDRHQISVFDGRIPVEVSSSGSLEVQPVREIPLTEVNEAVALYQAEQFSSGDFWEGQEAANNYRASQAVDVKLLSSLKVVRQHLRTRCNLDAPLADRLLVVCILIKYLEENGTAERFGNAHSVLSIRTT